MRLILIKKIVVGSLGVVFISGCATTRSVENLAYRIKTVDTRHKQSEFDTRNSIKNLGISLRDNYNFLNEQIKTNIESLDILENQVDDLSENSIDYSELIQKMEELKELIITRQDKKNEELLMSLQSRENERLIISIHEKDNEIMAREKDIPFNNTKFVSAHQLRKEYQQNAVKAEIRYSGKGVIINGLVNSAPGYYDKENSIIHLGLGLEENNCLDGVHIFTLDKYTESIDIGKEIKFFCSYGVDDTRQMCTNESFGIRGFTPMLGLTEPCVVIE
jgi:hypothetical protein